MTCWSKRGEQRTYQTLLIGFPVEESTGLAAISTSEDQMHGAIDWKRQAMAITIFLWAFVRCWREDSKTPVPHTATSRLYSRTTPHIKNPKCHIDYIKLHHPGRYPPAYLFLYSLVSLYSLQEKRLSELVSSCARRFRRMTWPTATITKHCITDDKHLQPRLVPPFLPRKSSIVLVHARNALS